MASTGTKTLFESVLGSVTLSKIEKAIPILTQLQYIQDQLSFANLKVCFSLLPLPLYENIEHCEIKNILGGV